MSTIDLLNKDELWLEFLEYKKESHMPQKIIKKYEEFILNKRYEKIANSMANETYTFSLPKKIIINKMGKSKKRIVYQYNEDESFVLKMLNHLLYKYDYLYSPNLYSFRKNTGVKKAIYYLTKYNNLNDKYGYKVDIQNYFNSIPVEKMLITLKVDLNDDKLYNLFYNLLTNKKVIYEENIIQEEKGVMAGVPISSFFANYYLKDLDKYFYDNNILYCRYADDIIVFDDDLTKLNNHRNYIKNFLKEKNLTINPEKEFFYNPKDEFEFLGFSYKNGIIDINKNSFKKIKGKIRRTAKGLRRWKIRKESTNEITLKAMNRKFNKKFYGKNETDLTWKYWFFPIINTTKTLKEIDLYMQDWQRYIVTGCHNKKNYEKAPYELLKNCNYKTLVHEFYKNKK